MSIPKKNKLAIYHYLLLNGVLIGQPKTWGIHPDLEDIQNLHVLRTLKSLNSRGYVRQQINFGHCYWFLNNDGGVFLRDLLNIPAQAVRQDRTVPPARRIETRT